MTTRTLGPLVVSTLILAQGCRPASPPPPAAPATPSAPATADAVATHTATAAPQGAAKVAPAIEIASLPNLRDIGGHATSDGRTVRRGLLYRSGHLFDMPPADVAKLGTLGLVCDYDLRLDYERDERPDKLPPGVKMVPLDVLADATDESSRRIDAVLRNPRRVSTTPGGNTADAAAAMVLMYRDFVALPSAKAAYGGLFKRLAEEGGTPAILHCTSGKDRSGWATASLLTLLGVPKEAVMADFLKSNEFTMARYEKAAAGFVAAGGEAGVFPAVLGVKAEYLEASFDEVTKRCGSIEKYFSEGLGVDAAAQAKLKAKFLQ